jgi:hypothetical protein
VFFDVDGGEKADEHVVVKFGETEGSSDYKVTDEGLDMVLVSGDEFESEGCIAFPWSRNARETLIEMNVTNEDGW